MLRSLIAKEIHNNLLNARFLFAYFAIAVLVTGSAAVMLSDYTREKREYELNRETYNTAIQSASSYQDFANTTMASRKPQPLSLFAVGGERMLDAKAALHWWVSPVFRGELKRSPIGTLFPPLDMVFVVGIVLSLVVVMLTFDAVAGERESGVLRVMLSSPVPRDVVIAAKWLGAFICLAIPLLTSMALVGLMLAFTPPVGLTPQDWVRIALLVVLFLLYLAAMLSLSLLVSVVVRSASSSALALLIVWAASTLVVPALCLPAVHAVTRPTGPRSVETEGLLRAVARDSTQLALAGARRNKALLDWLGGRDWRALSEAERDIWRKQSTRAAVDEDGRMLDTLYGMESGFGVQQARREALAAWLARMTPFGCMQNAATSLAATGMRHEQDVQNSLNAYMRSLYSYYGDWCMRMAEVHYVFPGYAAPLYTPPRDRLDMDVRDAIVGMGILAGMAVLFFLAAHTAFLRMDIT